MKVILSATGSTPDNLEHVRGNTVRRGTPTCVTMALK